MKHVLCGVILILATGAAGQTTDNSTIEDDIDPCSGLIDADSALYGLEIAADNAMIVVGTRGRPTSSTNEHLKP